MGLMVVIAITVLSELSTGSFLPQDPGHDLVATASREGWRQIRFGVLYRPQSHSSPGRYRFKSCDWISFSRAFYLTYPPLTAFSD